MLIPPVLVKTLIFNNDTKADCRGEGGYFPSPQNPWQPLSHRTHYFQFGLHKEGNVNFRLNGMKRLGDEAMLHTCKGLHQCWLCMYVCPWGCPSSSHREKHDIQKQENIYHMRSERGKTYERWRSWVAGAHALIIKHKNHKMDLHVYLCLRLCLCANIWLKIFLTWQFTGPARHFHFNWRVLLFRDSGICVSVCVCKCTAACEQEI